MTTMKRFIIMVGMAVSLLLAACASSPEPFEYEPNNELKPGPGIITGEGGVFTIYGEPPPVQKEKPVSEDPPPNEPAAQ